MNLWDLLEQETKKLKKEIEDRERGKIIAEDKKLMENEYNNAEGIVRAFYTYKYFIENLYERFVSKMITCKLNSSALLKPNEYIKGEISIESLHYYEFNCKLEKSAEHYEDVAIFYENNSEKPKIIICLNRNIYPEVILPFDQMLNNFIERHELSANKRNLLCPYEITAHFENIIKAYEIELELLPYLEAEVEELKATYGITIGDKKELNL